MAIKALLKKLLSVPRERIHLEIQCGENKIGSLVYAISSEGIKVFSAKKVSIGQKAVAEVQTTSVSGKFNIQIVEVETIPSFNNIIKQFPFVWRMGLKFTPQSDDESELVEKVKKLVTQ